MIDATRERVPPQGAGLGLEHGFAGWLRDLAGLGDNTPGRVTVHSLTVTRWVAVIGQLFSILFVHFSLDIALPIHALLPAVALSALVNVGLLISVRAPTRLSERFAAALYVYDLLQLCYLLALTGGIQNPFTALFLVPIALGAATLEMRSTAAVTGLALLALVFLTIEPGGLPWHEGPLVLPGLLRLAIAAALIIATILIAVFVWSIAEAARQRADALHVTQLALAREQQLSVLGGQAAAAAHLLGSPLGTITIIAREMVRELPPDSPLAEEAQDLLAQAQRCRELLKGLGRPAVDEGHERFTAAPLTTHLEQIAAEFARSGVTAEVRSEAVDDSPEPSLAMAAEFRHALANLIDNALQFARKEVLITVKPARSGLVLSIEDDGPGFPPEVLDWVGEPFISTRREQGGLGLGIFIAITLLARTGAKAHFENAARGARVTIFWPPDAVRTGFKGAEL